MQAHGAGRGAAALLCMRRDVDIAEDPAQGEESEGGARRARVGHSAATLGPLWRAPGPDVRKRLIMVGPQRGG